MGRLVAVLEKFAVDPENCFAPDGDPLSRLEVVGATEAELSALRTFDRDQIAAVLDARSNVICGIFAPDDVPERKDDDEDAPEGDEEEDLPGPGAAG